MLSIQQLYQHIKTSDPKLFQALDTICNASGGSGGGSGSNTTTIINNSGGSNIAGHFAVYGSPISISPPGSGIDGQHFIVDITQGATPQVVSWPGSFSGVSDDTVPLDTNMLYWLTFTYRASDGLWHLSSPIVSTPV